MKLIKLGDVEAEGKKWVASFTRKTRRGSMLEKHLFKTREAAETYLESIFRKWNI